MAKKRRNRNPKQFSLDEAQTATLILTEGTPRCQPVRTDKTYRYLGVTIRMCDKQALEPASRTFRKRIIATRTKRRSCPPNLFPPEGKGIWEVNLIGKKAQDLITKLDPLLTEEFKRKWRKTKQECR